MESEGQSQQTRDTREEIEGNVFHWFQKKSLQAHLLDRLPIPHLRPTSWDRLTPPCCHTRRERFLVITLPAVENKRSWAWSCRHSKYKLRQHNQPRETWNMHSTATPLVERILVLGKENGASLPYLFIILISLSAISALERSTEFTAAVAEPVTKKSLTSSIEPLTSVDASKFLTSSIKVMTIPRRSAQSWSCWSGGMQLRSSISAWQWLPASVSASYLFVCLFVVGIKPEKLYFASCVGREVNPLGVITHGQRHKAGNLHVSGSCKLREPKKKKRLTKFAWTTNKKKKVD